MEIWASIPDYSGLYEVSTSGNVRRGNGSLVAQRLDRYGYPKVNLNKSSVKRTHSVHNLVLRAFVGDRPDGMQCRHLDGNPMNNRIENLRWGTHAENVADRLAHSKHNSPLRALRQDQAESVTRYSGRIASLSMEYGVHPRHAQKAGSSHFT